MIISIAAEKAFDKIYHLFMIKILSKLGFEGTFLSTVKAMCVETAASIILNGKHLEVFSLRSEIREGYPVSSLYSI